MSKRQFVRENPCQSTCPDCCQVDQSKTMYKTPKGIFTHQFKKGSRLVSLVLLHKHCQKHYEKCLDCGIRVPPKKTKMIPRECGMELRGGRNY